jgi:membrane associated rhomboid family serine protease
MPKFKKFTVSNILILISVIFTIVWYLNPQFISEWSINTFYLKENFFHYIIQFFTWSFIHWGFLHLLMNSFFIYYFGNILEINMWRKKYIIFFIFSILFIWILLTNLSNNITIWISWFAMALLSYYTLELKSIKNPEYKSGITAILLNIAIWFYPGISLYWHLFWVIAWIIFYYITKDFFKRQIIWLFKYPKITQSTDGFSPLNIKKD